MSKPEAEKVDHSSENLNVAVVSYNAIHDAKWLNDLADRVEERKPEKQKMINNLRKLAKNALASYSMIKNLKEKSDSQTNRDWELRKGSRWQKWKTLSSKVEWRKCLKNYFGNPKKLKCNKN